ncbi:MAG: glycosyltransferase family 4 protein [Flavobacteriales bacterium]|nr:glycosyltransferase family 4 protein [Flavobacteriales bacterium]
MKIIHVVWAFRNGGIETMLVNTVSEQVKIGHKVSIIIINNSVDVNLIKQLSKKIKIFQINRKLGTRNILQIIKINLIVLKVYPQVIHFHSFNLKKIFVKYFKVKFITTIHSTHLDNDNIKNSDTIISISKSVSRDLVQNNPSLNPLLCYNGVDFTKIHKKIEFENIKKIICVGRLDDAHKGQSIIINALNIIKEKTALNLTLSIVGEGPDKMMLNDQIKKLKLENNITLLGNKSNNWVLSNLCHYDLFIQSSRFEGFGLTALEALAAKVPAVLSNIEGHLEISDNGKYASLFNSEDPIDLADKIVRLSNEFNLLKDKSEKAYNYVLTHFSINSNVKRLNKIYKL